MKHDENNPIKQALLFLEEEPDEQFRIDLKNLIDKAQHDTQAMDELRDRFCGTLSFGTAGLRGKMESGTQRMNRPMVMRVAWALAHYVASPHAPLGKGNRVVVAYDGRHHSAQFAKDVCQVLLAHGCEVHAFTHCTATPLCAFAVTHLQANAGVMITASHNPPQDNGLKIYGPHGAQLVEPHTPHLEALLQKAPGFDALANFLHLTQEPHFITQSLFDAYFEAVTQASLHPHIGSSVPVSIVHTAMHGVGSAVTTEALTRAGFSHIVEVESQKEPDGAFPTVKFPNPEEDGALAEATLVAQKHQADLVLANDPDADRLAVMVPKPNGEWTALSGNEVGVLLGADVLEYSKNPKEALVMTTLVSSQMLGVMAKAHEACYAETITGFANIMHQAFQIEQTKAVGFAFGYEEALGYCVGNIVKDKDGVSAAVRMAELFAFLKQQGRTVWQELERLALKHGVFVSKQWSLRFDGPKRTEQIRRLIGAFRQNPQGVFTGELHMQRYEDLLEHPQSDQRANVMVVHTTKGVRIVIRPSGTEPKVKFYLEAHDKVMGQENVSDVRNRLTGLLDTTCNALQSFVDTLD